MILCMGTTPAIARTMQYDSLRIGEVNRTLVVHDYAAGKAVNVARVVTTLGAEASVLGVAGGLHGASLLALLDRDRLHHQFVSISAATRICTTVVDLDAQNATELVEESPPMATGEEVALFDLFEAQLPEADIVVLSGSLARGVRRDFYARATMAAHARGSRVVLDASGEPLRTALASRPDVVKINADELAGIVTEVSGTGEAGLVEQARFVNRMTGGAVIITRGSAPTIAIDPRGDGWRVASVRVERPVSPIGCGDSFAAGVAIALSREESIEQWLALGSACAVANVLTPHAAHVDPREVERIRAHVRLTRL